MLQSSLEGIAEPYTGFRIPLTKALQLKSTHQSWASRLWLHSPDCTWINETHFLGGQFKQSTFTESAAVSGCTVDSVAEAPIKANPITAIGSCYIIPTI